MQVYLLQTDITDHFTTCVSIPLNTVVTVKNKLIFIIDHDKIKKNLIKEKWTEVYNKNNANECFFEFQKIISSYIHKSTTFKKITSKNFRLKEWMSTGLLCSTRHKQSLSLKCRSNPNNTKLALHYNIYTIHAYSLNKVYQCLRDRNLTLNEQKTMFMTFSIYKSFPNLNPITIHRCVDGSSCNNVSK